MPNKILIILVGATLLVSANLYAAGFESMSDAEVANHISDDLQNRQNKDLGLNRARMKAQKELLTKSVNPEVSGFFAGEVSSMNRKCYPWDWSGGEYDKIAVDIFAELCLVSRFDEDLNVDSMESRVESRANAKIHIQENTYDGLDAEFSTSLPMQGSARANGTIRVMGYTIWSGSNKLPRTKFSKQFGPVHFEKSSPYNTVIGPLPITINLGVRSEAKLRFEASIHQNNVRALAIPDLNSEAFAIGGSDVWLLSAGVRADMTIIDDAITLEGKFGVNVLPTSNPLRFIYVGEVTGDNELAALSGNIILEVESAKEIPKYGDRFEYPVYSWEGFFQTDTLFNNRIGPKEFQIKK